MFFVRFTDVFIFYNRLLSNTLLEALAMIFVAAVIANLSTSTTKSAIVIIFEGYIFSLSPIRINSWASTPIQRHDWVTIKLPGYCDWETREGINTKIRIKRFEAKCYLAHIDRIRG